MRARALVAASVLLLAAAELSLRLAHVEVTDWAYNSRKYGRVVVHDEVGGFTRHVPHAAIRAYGAAMRFNAHGMRDIEHAVAKPPETRRVLVLGDAATVGFGEDLAATFPRRLEALLAQDGAAPGRIEVIAAAVSGWNTVTERNYVRAEGLGFAPDLVVLVYECNDNDLRVPWTSAPRLPALARAWTWLSDRSRLVELASHAYRQRVPGASGDAAAAAEVARAGAAREAEHHEFEPDDRGWLASRAALEDIAAMTRERGIWFVVVLLEMGEPVAPAAAARLGEFATANGVPVFDAYRWFSGRSAAELLNGAIRPNALALGLLADGTAKTIVARALLR